MGRRIKEGESPPDHLKSAEIFREVSGVIADAIKKPGVVFPAEASLPDIPSDPPKVPQDPGREKES